MGTLLEQKKRTKRKARKQAQLQLQQTQEQLRQAKEERKEILEREFANQSKEPVTVVEIFNIIREVLDDTNRYRIQDELKHLLIRRAE